MLKLLDKLGAHLNKPDNVGIRPIHFAAANGRVRAIKALCAADKAVVNALDRHHATPVYVAALMGQARAVSALKALGANVNTPDNDGETPVHAAAERNHPGVIGALKAADANMNEPRDNGKTPLIVAVERNHPEVIRALKAADVNVHAPVIIASAGQVLAVMPLLKAVSCEHTAAIAAILAPVSTTIMVDNSSSAEKEIEEARKDQNELADAKRILMAFLNILLSRLGAEPEEIKTVQEVEQVSVSISPRGAEKAMLTQHNLVRDAANNNRGAAGSSQESKNLRRPRSGQKRGEG